MFARDKAAAVRGERRALAIGLAWEKLPGHALIGPEHSGGAPAIGDPKISEILR